MSDTTVAVRRADLHRATRGRVRLLTIVQGATAVAAVPAGMLWPESTGAGETYLYADVSGDRALWWGLLSFLSVLLVVNVPAQAIVTMLLRGRGATRAHRVGCPGPAHLETAGGHHRDPGPVVQRLTTTETTSGRPPL